MCGRQRRETATGKPLPAASTGCHNTHRQAVLEPRQQPLDGIPGGWVLAYTADMLLRTYRLTPAAATTGSSGALLAPETSLSELRPQCTIYPRATLQRASLARVAERTCPYQPRLATASSDHPPHVGRKENTVNGAMP
jgi:hypothetical protein